MRLMLVFILFARVLSGQVWFQLVNFPGTKRDDGVSVVVDNKAYFGTGLQEWNATIDFYSLDLASFTWSMIPTMPLTTERQYACAFPGTGCFYVFGGDGVGGALTNMYKYDIAASTWTSVSPKPGNGLIGASCMSFGNKIIIAGGKFQTGKVSDEVWEYNLATDSWVQKNNLPFAGRWRASATVWNNTGYLMFGRDTSGSFRKELYSYNPINDQWIKVNDFPGPGRAYAALNVSQNNLFMFGGIDSLGNYYKDIRYFFPLSNSWLQGPDLLSSGRKGGMSCASGNLFVYPCGIGPGDQRTTETWMTDIPVGIKENIKAGTISIYPNPTEGTLRISSFPNKMPADLTYSISDLCGRTLTEEKFLSEENDIDLRTLKEGVYFLNLFSEKQLIDIRKIIRN